MKIIILTLFGLGLASGLRACWFAFKSSRQKLEFNFDSDPGPSPDADSDVEWRIFAIYVLEFRRNILAVAHLSAKTAKWTAASVVLNSISALLAMLPGN